MHRRSERRSTKLALLQSCNTPQVRSITLAHPFPRHVHSAFSKSPQSFDWGAFFLSAWFEYPFGADI